MSTGNTTATTDMFLTSWTSYCNKGGRKQVNREINEVMANFAEVLKAIMQGSKV